jgi:hypothetical protein
MPKLSENATLVDRIRYYIEVDERTKAQALAQLGDYLEECFLWDISFSGETL